MITRPRFAAFIPVVAVALLAACGGDGGSKSGSGTTPPPAPDTTAPTTTIDTSPAPLTPDSVATFTFSSSENATFQASLDGAAFSTAISPLTLTALADGLHTLRVRARDAAGNVDATPATAQWIVAVPTPDTAISAHPDAVTRATAATFAFTSPDAGSTFEVSLDGATFAAALPPVLFDSLSAGTHTVNVRARNAASVADPTPATFSWTVDLLPPTARIAFPLPVSYTDAATIAVRGNASDAHGVAAVRVDGILATTIDNFDNWRADVPVAFGVNSITVSVTDVAGNVANNAAAVSVTNRGPLASELRGLSYDAAGARLIGIDRRLNVVYSLPLADGVPRVISPASAAGLVYYMPTDLGLDLPRDRALVLEGFNNKLVAVNLTTGVRTIVSPAAEGIDDLGFADSSQLAVDPVNNRAFVTNSSYQSLVAIDLATGVRAVVSGGLQGVGGGRALSSIAGIVYDDTTQPGSPRVLVSQGNQLGSGRPDRILSVDLASGVRTVVSSWLENIGTGPTLDRPTLMELDAPNNRLLVLDPAGQRILAVSLATGNRSVIDDAGFGGAITGAPTRGLAFDAAHDKLFLSQYPNQILAIDVATAAHSTFYDVQVGSGVAMDDHESMVIEQKTGTAASLLLSSRNQRELLRVDLASGGRSVVSSMYRNVGAGPDLEDLADIALDTRASTSGHSALALAGGSLHSLVSIDLVTGDRTPIVDLNSAAPAVSFPRSLRLDAANNRAYFSDTPGSGTDEWLYSVDLATGVRTTLTGPGRGSGPTLDRASNFVLAPAVDPTHAILADEGPGGLFSVDFATGNRSLFLAPFAEDPLAGSSVIASSQLDPSLSRILAMRGGTSNNLMAIPLSGAAPQVLSGEDPLTGLTTGRGPVPYTCFALAVDDTDRVSYQACPWISSLMMIDLVSGDRVVIAR